MNAKYKEFLSAQIENLCTNGKYALNLSSEDKIPKEVIIKARDRALKFGDDFYDTLVSETTSSYFERLDDFFEELNVQAIKTEDIEIIASLRGDSNLFENLCKCGFKGIALDFDKLLEQTTITVVVNLKTTMQITFNIKGNEILSLFNIYLNKKEVIKIPKDAIFALASLENKKLPIKAKGVMEIPSNLIYKVWIEDFETDEKVQFLEKNVAKYVLILSHQNDITSLGTFKVFSEAYAKMTESFLSDAEQVFGAGFQKIKKNILENQDYESYNYGLTSSTAWINFEETKYSWKIFEV